MTRDSNQSKNTEDQKPEATLTRITSGSTNNGEKLPGGQNIAFLVILAGIILLALAARPLVRGLLPKTPTPTPSATPIPPVVTIVGIREMAELATVEYLAIAEVHNQSVPEDLRGQLGIKEEVLLLVYGNVKAGFDLSDLGEENVWTDGTRVQLRLPSPQILSTEIDYERTHAVTYQGSVFFRNPELLKETFGLAKVAIDDAAIEGGVLEMASRYGETFFENYLRSLGFTEVQVIVDWEMEIDAEQ